VDNLARFNQARWDALVDAGISFSRPLLDLTPTTARDLVDPHGVIERSLGDVNGRPILCLASGGGQQAPAFGLLGANVTIMDLSPRQLDQERRAAAHYGLSPVILQGDMRDLAHFDDNAFELVFQPYSINFVPSVEPVFDGVMRVLRPGGLYRLEFANPFVMSIEEGEWTPSGYPLRRLYGDGEVIFSSPAWDVYDEAGTHRAVEGPREFVHTLSTVLNGLATRGFQLLGLWEFMEPDVAPAPGTWEHYTQVAPPWFSAWFRLQ
jgi:SAM-dependent methyltransferase